MALAGLELWRQKDELQGASLRLREGMRLRIADTERIVETTEKWYRIATDYKLALGVLRTPTPRIGGSGFLVEGGSLRPDWSGRAVFLTTSHNLPPPEDLSDSYIIFPGIDETSRFRVDTALFESPPEDLDVAVLGLVETPRRAVPVVLGAEQGMKQALDGVAVLQWTSRDGFAMGFGHAVTVPVGGPWPDRIYYTYVTGPGASGAPVFDADSGSVACLHIGALREPVLRVAYCTPIAGILAAITG